MRLELTTLLCWAPLVAVRAANAPVYGIRVPGQSTDAADVLHLFANSCRPKSANHEQRSAVQNSLLNFLANPRGRQLASQVTASLYFALGNVQIEKLMGRWYRVLDSPSVHHEACVVSYFKLLHRSAYLATFTTKDYFRNGESVEQIEGHGQMIGPEPGQLLISTGHPLDPCPYTLVKVGPLDSDGYYDYAILSQFAKHPVMVLARDPTAFDLYHKEDVANFLHTNKFDNPLVNAYVPLRFVDFQQCPSAFYFNLS